MGGGAWFIYEELIGSLKKMGVANLNHMIVEVKTK